jgi:thiosulfate reductase cytochrome b subunit
MNPTFDAVAFQAQLVHYATIYRPVHWPHWLIAATGLLIAMLLVLAVHGALRHAFAGHAAQPDGQPLYLYPVPVRLWHWSNAALFVLLLGSGLISHFALLAAPATAWLVGFHVVCGFLLAGAWLGFLVINLVTGNGRHYRVRLGGLTSRLTRQAVYYLWGILRGEPHPFHADGQSKFNPLQQVTYLGVVHALIPALLVTGLFSYCPEWLGASLAGLRHGIFVAHEVLAVASVFFIFGHLYLCTTGRTPTETFRAMIDGYHR